MWRIRVLRDDHSAANAATLSQMREMITQQFPLATQAETLKVAERLRRPMAEAFWPLVLVAEDFNGRLLAFASVFLYQPLQLAHLEFISASPSRAGSGLGGMLYERLREECRQLGCTGLLFECLPDDDAITDAQILKENRQRLRFYEHFGVYPMINTGYENPGKPSDPLGAFMMYDDLGSGEGLSRAKAQAYIPVFLAYKYPKECPLPVGQRVAQGFVDDPIQLRAPRYLRKTAAVKAVVSAESQSPYAIVVNDQHEIHHVRDRGYVEAPVRIARIRDELNKTGLFKELPAESTEDSHITAVHDAAYVNYLKKICKTLPENQSIYPAVFPIRNATRPPKDLAMQAGYYCMDTFTPLNGNAYRAARAAVDCTLTAANAVIDHYSMAYALVRPPGHHAERRAFGGFCYFNSSAIAAHYLSRYGRVAVLDVDFHHGNGTQDIFYRRNDVFTASIHGDPVHAYPFFSGFADETGDGDGVGYNLNIPLPERITPEKYQQSLKKALKVIRDFSPEYFVLALGFDTAKSDPTGTWSLTAEHFRENARLIAKMPCPILVVQEGGYRTRTLGQNARAFFEGFYEGRTK
ncbi:MAG TPA: histone deacetylase family protein [Pseudomonadales bacterium]